jgi:hypothetical protein
VLLLRRRLPHLVQLRSREGGRGVGGQAESEDEWGCGGNTTRTQRLCGYKDARPHNTRCFSPRTRLSLQLSRPPSQPPLLLQRRRQLLLEPAGGVSSRPRLLQLRSQARSLCLCRRKRVRQAPLLLQRALQCSRVLQGQRGVVVGWGAEGGLLWATSFTP